MPTPDYDVLPGPDTVAHLIASQADRTPEAPAIAAPDCRPLSYRQLNTLMQEGVRALRDAGVGRHDRVAIVLPNGPELATTVLTVTAGAGAAPLDPASHQTELEFSLEDLRAKAVIVYAANSNVRAAAAARGVPVIELAPRRDVGAGNFTLASVDGAMPRSQSLAGPGDVALVLRTSGTTARPKVVPLTHRNLCTSAANIHRTLGLTGGDRCLNVMPLFHVHGLMTAVLGSLAAGGTVVCAPRFDAGRFFDWLAESRATWYTAVPTIHQSVLEEAWRTGGPIGDTSLRFIRSASSPLPPRVMKELERTFGVPVIESYGMTEAAHQICSNPLPPGRRKPGSVGLPAGPEVAVMDDSGRLLPNGTTGEIVIRGENVTAGYERDPAANDAAFENGWFRTGDQGVIDAEGYVSLTGRLKEVINRAGRKISPRQIEEAFLDHPAITQAVSFAVPHRSLGEDVAVAVVLRPDQRVTEQQLRQFAFTRLADFMVPSRVVFVEEIPTGAAGKPQRLGLYRRLAVLLRPPYQAPATPVEEVLAGIWSDVLRTGLVGRDDNFFILGGDSLAAARVQARVRAALRLELPLAALFRAPTITEMSLVVEDLLLRDIEGPAATAARPPRE